MKIPYWPDSFSSTDRRLSVKTNPATDNEDEDDSQGSVYNAAGERASGEDDDESNAYDSDSEDLHDTKAEPNDLLDDTADDINDCIPEVCG